jgi:hypothetical protein
MTSRFPSLQGHKTRSGGKVFFMIHTLIESFRVKRSGLPARISKQNQGDSCGCAMGARFLAFALVSSIVWYAWHWHSSMLSIWAILLRVLVWAFVATCIGKIVGIVEFRLRSRKSRVKPKPARLPHQRALKVFR